MDTTTNEMNIQRILLAALVPSTFNPRGKHSRDADSLKELAADIAVHGVQQAILVRPLTIPTAQGGDGTYEIVFGTRRVEASKLAGYETIPAMVRELSAEEAMELCMVENLQRADLHFMDEAAGFEKLMAGGLTAEQVGERVGKPAVYVFQRANLNKLIPKWEAAAYKGTLRLGGALYLARLTAAVQQTIFKECKEGRQGEEGEFSVGRIKRIIETEILRRLDKAPFDVNSGELLPEAGACLTCPKRTGASPLLFPEIKEADVCTDSACFEKKTAALVALKLKEHPGAVQIIGVGVERLEWQQTQDLFRRGVLAPRRSTPTVQRALAISRAPRMRASSRKRR